MSANRLSPSFLQEVRFKKGSLALSQTLLAALPVNMPTIIAWSLAAAYCIAAGPANAQTTNLADVPLAVLNSVTPNTYITLDRSGSMTWIMSDDKYNYPVDYNKTIRYRPWLIDATIPPPKGPVRFKDADLASFCNGIDNWEVTVLPSPTTASAIVSIASYQPGSGTTPDVVIPYCNTKGDTFRHTTSNSATSGLTNYNINTLPIPSPRPIGRTDCASASGCTAAEEKQNFVNYWQYHRDRNLATRAAIGEVFGRQSYKARTGFAYYSSAMNPNVKTSGIMLLDGARDCNGNAVSRLDQSCRYTFFKDHIYAPTYIIGGTPTRVALIETAKVFQNPASYLDYPTQSAGTTNKYRSCRNNYNILITDGEWNTGCSSTFSTIGNADKNAGFPFNDDFGNTTSTGNSDCRNNAGPTLADIAYYYWNTDLVPSLANNVPTTKRDPNRFQHLVNYTVAMKMYGKLTQSDIDTLFYWLDHKDDNPAAEPAVAKLEVITTIINKIKVKSGTYDPNPLPQAAESKGQRVDDLVHAAMNSRGIHFNASNPQQLTQSLLSALNDTIGRSTSAPVSFTNPELRSDRENMAYITGFDASNWSGQMQAYPVDAESGEIRFNAPQWSPPAETQLDDRFHNASNGHHNRIVVTWKGTNDAATVGNKGIPFRPDSVLPDGALSSLFHLMTNNDGPQVVNYIRGDSSNEGIDDLNFRQRASLLGDIVTAGPVLIRDPKKDYADPGYLEYIEAQKNREATVFVGSNDGMIHAFDAKTGRESWAYVPSFAYRCELAGDACQPTVTGAKANPLRDRAMPYGVPHKFLVDGILFDNDVDFASTSVGGQTDWHTILTASLGKGGRGVVALDVTTPQATSETDAAKKVLWEFPYFDNDGNPIAQAKNVGYITDRIHIGKVDIGGNARWVAIIPSGYNNGSGSNGANATGSGGDGKARLFILDAATGKLIKEIIAGKDDDSAGTSANPANMARIGIHTIKEDVDHSVDSAIYGGDQLGNLWRFDMSGGDPDGWVAQRIAVLKDPQGKPQPVTTEPLIIRTQEVDRSMDRLWVIVGTGRYLDTTDRPQAPGNTAAENTAAAQTQTIYAFKDPFQKNEEGNYVESGAEVSNLRANLAVYRMQAASDAVGSERVAHLESGANDDTIGWLVDLGQYERVTVDPKGLYSFIVVGVNAPTDDPCIAQGKGSILALSLLDYYAAKSPNIFAGYSFGNTMISAMTVVQTETGVGKVVASVSEPLSAAECNQLIAAKPGSFCTGDDGKSSTTGATVLGFTVPIPPAQYAGPPRRMYWNTFSIGN